MNVNGIKCVLLDIEGTVCPISFVKETLFPYAIRALPDVLSTKWDEAEFRSYRDAFPEEYRSSPATLQAHVEDLTRRDVKVAYLKNLQGFLWEDGYTTGAYSTPLFPDVGPKLKAWRAQGLQVAIYSSGSVFAQKLLFGHINVDDTLGSKRQGVDGDAKTRGDSTGEGKATITTESATDDPSEKTDNASTIPKPKTEDMTSIISGWFDTTNAGLKADATSYTTIATALKWQPSEILFLSDNVHEVDAAIQAGMNSIVVDRPGNVPLSSEDQTRLKAIKSLESITLNLSN
ncbi:Enolase-phosphatase E1 [Acrodontium crateriforme]|uniref:Enolase-phosphatase E1 n=1 Tax=Acrodontium crateriforme TaxID=150365 RepID=A0AAQ3M423_9PEZI|nr:Enolase-phosphatase E1 [Acrodontium crateriforme]